MQVGTAVLPEFSDASKQQASTLMLHLHGRGGALQVSNVPIRCRAQFGAASQRTTHSPAAAATASTQSRSHQPRTVIAQDTAMLCVCARVRMQTARVVSRKAVCGF